MIGQILRLLLKNADKSSAMNEAELASMTKLIEASDAILPKIFIFFIGMFILSFFMFFTMTAIGLIIFTLISYFGDISELASKNDFPEDIKLYFLLGGLTASTLSFVSFKAMKLVWGKLSQVKEEELKLKL